jgi:hypothetical protein
MVRPDAIRQRIHRVRRKKVDYGPNPSSLAQIEIPPQLRTTYSGREFLLRDSGVESMGRILIFGTEESVKILKENRVWYGDGTFAVSPDLFYQMYTVNIILKNKNLPLIYALLPNKEEKTYKLFLELLLMDFDENELPKKIIHDFEKGVLNAIQARMKLCKILGCYFHFCQNLWKNMQKKGLSNSYIVNKDIRTSFKNLKALCFFPVNDVIKAFNYIKSTAPSSFAPMLTYFEKYYIGKPKKNNPGVRAVPCYPMAMWNCYQRVMDGEERTNNSIEAWHRQFEVNILLIKRLKNFFIIYT